MPADIGLEGVDRRVGRKSESIAVFPLPPFSLANQRRGAAHILGLILGLILGIGLMTLLVSAGVGDRLEGRAV
jgi:hypothetical protein